MNNKRGGAGAIVILVLILMLASAVGGAYAYRVIDGKLAVRDAMKAVEDVDISDYDTPEQTVIQGYIDDATKDLSTAKTRKEVYEIIAKFISDVDKVKTKNEKELEEALKAAEEAKKQYSNQNSYDNSGNTGNNSGYNTDGSTGTYDSSGNTGSDDNSSGTYKSNELTNPDDGTDSSKDDDNGFLNSLLGGLSSGTSGN